MPRKNQIKDEVGYQLAYMTPSGSSAEVQFLATPHGKIVDVSFGIAKGAGMKLGIYGVKVKGKGFDKALHVGKQFNENTNQRIHFYRVKHF